MFSTSTQLKCWTFSSQSEIEKLRREAHFAFISNLNPEVVSYQLTCEDESIIRRYYECRLQRFCSNFQPPMPNYVAGTAMVFFKRLYLHHSLMDFNVEIYMFTCVYLACKVEEFNLSIRQFIANINLPDMYFRRDATNKKSNKKFLLHNAVTPVDSSKMICDSERLYMDGSVEVVEEVSISDEILMRELPLMRHLHYHLTVHNPYRPVEGLLIDIKTRCPEVGEAERLRNDTEKFLNRFVLSDACLLFAPAQVALAALVTSGASLGVNVALDSYIANKLMSCGSYEMQQKFASHMRKLRQIIREVEEISFTQVEKSLKKLKIFYQAYNSKATEINSVGRKIVIGEKDNVSSILSRMNEENLLEEDEFD